MQKEILGKNNEHNRIKQKNIQFPIYLPDATRGITKSIDSIDLTRVNIEAAVVNTYHLMSTPGIATLKNFKGIKNFMNFDGLVVSDSGGWQVFSLLKRHNLPGKITEEGVQFNIGLSETNSGSKKNPNKEFFTPEKSIQTQFAIGSDIMICLDDFSSTSSTRKENEEIVDRTIRWAKRSKDEYLKQMQVYGLNDETRPLLFAVIQGGLEKDLRAKCAEKLLEIGFDGYGYGGYVVEESTGKINLDISKYLAELIPDEYYKFALGFGKPEDIVSLYSIGWEIFDCTIPTRDARHKRLFVSKGQWSTDDIEIIKHKPIMSLETAKKLRDYDFLYINKSEFSEDARSIDENCDCHTCSNFSRAYVHHLFKINDTTAFRLATIHNLRFYTRLIESLRV